MYFRHTALSALKEECSCLHSSIRNSHRVGTQTTDKVCSRKAQPWKRGTGDCFLGHSRHEYFIVGHYNLTLTIIKKEHVFYVLNAL